MRSPLVVLSLSFIVGGGVVRAEPALKSQPAAGLKAALKMKRLQSVLDHHYETHDLLAKTKLDAERTIDSVGAADRIRVRERKAWVPLGVDPQMRKLTVRAITQRMRADSAKLKARIAQSPETAVWDVVFVGAGPNTANTANELAHATNGAPMKMLTVEAGDLVSANFGRLGNTFGRNSSNRAAREGQALQRGRGDKNPSTGPWGDPDLAGGEYPGVGGFADVATVNLFASGSDVLMSSKVKVARPIAKGPAKYKVELADGSAVYANQVVVSTGFANKDLDLDSRSNAVIAEERGKVDYTKPNKVPGIVTVAEALSLANLSQTGRDAYRQQPGAKGEKSFWSPDLARVRLKKITDTYTSNVDYAYGRMLANQHDDAYVKDGRAYFLKNGKVSDVSLQRPALQALAEADLSVKGPADAFDTRDAARDRVAAFMKSGLAGAAGVYISGYKLVGGLTDELIDVRIEDGKLLTVNAIGSVTSRPLDFKGAEKLAADPLFRGPGKRPDRPTPIMPRIAVIGGKDSGRTFLEYLFGLSDESAYTGAGKRDVAQRGEVADVEWVVGANGPKDCREFLQSTRSRYLKLAGKVRAPEDAEPKAKLVQRRLTGIRRLEEGADAGKYELSYDNGKRTAIVDRVVLANGVEARPADVLEPTAVLEPLRGEVANLSGERVIARRVKGEDIFVQGAAAGTEVAGADEIYATKENAASIFNFAPRGRELARVLARGKRADKTIDTSFLAKTQREALTPGTGKGEFAIARVEFDALARVMPTSLKTAAVKHDLAEILDGFRFPGVESLTLTIAPSGDALSVRSPQLDRASIEKIGKAIADNPTLVYELSSIAGTKRPITLRADVRNNDNEKIAAPERKGLISVSSLRLEI